MVSHLSCQAVSVDQGLDSRSLLEKVEPHAEVTWLRPADIWSRYLGESEERGRTRFWLMVSYTNHQLFL